jgi:chemosensory pili system protein ChpB (putative protein-glutamate methylesterase)
VKVWVLAASTGGIDAVTRFLKLVPCRENVALVYVQHIVEQQHPQLLKIVARNSNWRTRSVDYGSSLKGGWVTIPSPEERFDIDGEGLMGVVDSGGWQAPYRPNIDDVARQVATFYRHCSGLIVFTGMGGDGCKGAACVRDSGGQVWVQTPSSCAAIAMPEAVLGAGGVMFVGTVEELAEKFNQEIGVAD